MTLTKAIEGTQQRLDLGTGRVVLYALRRCRVKQT